ncbi:MAG: TfoX/Sxy family protein [Rhizobiaceae bacterium]|nr:TfoX/Sxy family protein [Rhizobiaceae bacterium]
MDDDSIRDLFAGLGPVSIRRMFGGKGIYFDGLIVGLDLGDEVVLKADAVSAPRFESAGSRQWTYDGQKKPVAMPYWSIPDSAIDDSDELRTWTRLAYEAALRAKKPEKSPGRKKK